MFDVHVVGAGPAGAFAAIHAQRVGHTVKLSEEHARIGQPVHCSGLVSASGLEQMSDIVPYKQIVRNTIRRANLHGADARVTLTYPSPKAYVIDRGGFDRLAVQRYVDEGGRLFAGERIRTRADLQGRHIIGADGPISTVARLFHFPRLRHFAACWQGDFAYAAPDLSAVEVFFNPGLAPGFIGWVIPVDEETAKIGLGVATPASLHEAKARFLRPFQLEGAKPSSEFSALIPISPRARTAGVFEGPAPLAPPAPPPSAPAFPPAPSLSSAPAGIAAPSPGSARPPLNVCLVGDAAGQVKSTSGGGIFFGATCGRLAGKLAHDPFEYERTWRRLYGADLRLHRLLRQGLDLMPPSALDLWMSTLRLFRLDLLLTEVGEMDEFSKMVGLRTLEAYVNVWTREHAPRALAPPMAAMAPHPPPQSKRV